jgi:hypothetical protein
MACDIAGFLLANRALAAVFEPDSNAVPIKCVLATAEGPDRQLGWTHADGAFKPILIACHIVPAAVMDYWAPISKNAILLILQGTPQYYPACARLRPGNPIVES